MFKLFVLMGIAISGLASLAGVPGMRLENVSQDCFFCRGRAERVREIASKEL